MSFFRRLQRQLLPVLTGLTAQRIKRIPIKEGDVYVSADSAIHRRVVTIHGDCICYSRGGDRSYICKRSTFVRWLRKQKREKGSMEATCRG